MAYYPQPGQQYPPPNSYYPPPPPPPPPGQQGGYYEYQTTYQQHDGYYGAPSPPPMQSPYGPPPEQQSYQPPYTGHTGGYKKFDPKPKYNDLWASILFIIQLIGFIILGAFSIPKSLKEEEIKEGISKDDVVEMVIIMAVAAVIAFALSLIYLLLMQRFAGKMIKITFILSIILYLALAILMFYWKSYIFAAFTLFFAVLYAWMYYAWRDRMPFAKIMLKTVCSVTRKYGGTIGVAIGGLIADMVWSLFWIISFTSAMVMLNTKRCENAGLTNDACGFDMNAVMWVVFVFALLSLYWTSQVIQNVVHVTICGVFGTFYFLEGTPQMPTSSVTLGALKRSVTSAFGSICFGSLIIALIQTIRAILRTLAESDDGALAFVACIVACILGYIEALIEYFNTYAFAQVAIYGKPFCQASKDTWTMIKDRGVEAIINDNLVGNVLGIGVLFIGFLTCGCGYLYLLAKDGDFITRNPIFTTVTLVACFIIGMLIMSMVAGVINSGVVSTFVALAEDPMALARTKPQLFEKIRQTWPDVVVGVRG